MSVEHVAVVGPIAPVDVLDLLDGESRARALRFEGYRGVPTADLVRVLIGKGIRVDVITHAADVDAELELSGPRLRILLAPRRPHATLRALDGFREERCSLQKLLKASNAQVIHALWTYEFAAAAVLDGRPCLVTAHDAPWTVARTQRGFYRFARAVLASTVSRRIARLTAVSPYLADRWRREMGYKAPIRVIPNIVQPRFSGVRTIRGTRVPSVLCVADNGRIKNVPRLLDALRLVAREQPNLRVRLIGSGLDGTGRHGRRVQRDPLLRERTELLGLQQRKAIDAALDEATLFVHPSLEESFGLSVAEAMASGVPVVGGSESGAVPWLLEDGRAGYLADVRRPRKLAEAIIAALHHPADAAARALRARSRVEAEFSPDRVAALYLAEYAEVRRSHE